MNEKPKRGRGRPLSQRTLDVQAFDAAIALHPPSAKMIACAEKVNAEILDSMARSVATSRAAWTHHNNPSPAHNGQQKTEREARVREVRGWLEAASVKERALSASALAQRWKHEGKPYSPRMLAEYIREARKLYGPNWS